MLTKILIKKFIQNSDKINEPAVRKSYGTLSSVTGIICNIILFLLKFSTGILSGSVSIISDAVNNLSDCAGCIVTFFGYKLAAKPADRDHPFGHGRAEYLAAMLLAVMVMLMGFTLLKDSVQKIIEPEAVVFHGATMLVLIFSIAVKLWMAAFNTMLGKRIDSSVMLAAARDSRSDVIATSAAAVSLIASCFTDFPVDGYAGVLVSFFILKAGYDIIKDTLDDLLGRPADKEKVCSIKRLALAHEKVIDVHDIVLHNYGPSHTLGSCHLEISSEESFCAVHELADHIEKRIWEDTGINMTIHTDPVDIDNQTASECREFISRLISGLDKGLSIHDFRLVKTNCRTSVTFDLVVPFDCKYKKEQLRAIIDTELHRFDPEFDSSITFDCEMTE